MAPARTFARNVPGGGATNREISTLKKAVYDYSAGDSVMRAFTASSAKSSRTAEPTGAADALRTIDPTSSSTIA